MGNRVNSLLNRFNLEMNFYSQIDPEYKFLTLPKSSLTIGAQGCFLTSLCNLSGGTMSPPEAMKTKGGFVRGGYLISGVLAEALGMKRGKTIKEKPEGWCIGVTDKYKSKGVPTHFVCINHDTEEMIDPLTFPAKIEPNIYDFYEYRLFDEVGNKNYIEV